MDYEWAFDTDLYTDDKDNLLKVIEGTAAVQDGQLVANGAVLELVNGVSLAASENWIAEWKIDGEIGNHVMLSSEKDISTTGSWCILRVDGTYYLSTFYNSKRVNFLLSEDGYTYGSHTYTLKCVDGVISFAVDGVTTCENIKTATVCVGTKPVENEQDIANYRKQLDGAVFLFKYLGTTYGELTVNGTLDSLYFEKG